MRYFVSFVLAIMTVASAACADDLPIVDIKTPHGITFSFYHSEVQSTVAVALAFKGGLASDDPSGPATGLIAPTLLTAGAGGQSSAELFELFQDVGGQFAVSSNPDQTYATLSAPLKGIMGAAKLANLVLTKPDFPEMKVTQYREAFAQRLEEYLTYPDSKVQIAFSKAVSDPHPYQTFYNPSPASVRKVGRSDLASWIVRHITTDGIMVSVVGNLTSAEAATIVDQILDRLPAQTELADTPNMVFKPASALPIALTIGTGDQAVLMMGAALPFDRNLEEWTATSLLSTIFSGDQKSRLFKDIREATGSTYGLQPMANFYEVAMFNSIYGRLAKNDVEKTVQLIKSSWDVYRTKGPTDIEIANAKASMTRYLGDLSRSHVAMAGYIRDYLTGHWTTEQLSKLPSMVEHINLKDPALLARLFPPNPVIVIAQ